MCSSDLTQLVERGDWIVVDGSRGVVVINPTPGERTDYEISVAFDVKVPLIGGRITSWAKGDVSKQIKMEFEAGDRWLADHA